MSIPASFDTPILTPSVPRQTSPSFGTALVRTVGEIARGGLGLLGALTPGGPLLSAAMTGAATVSAAASGGAGGASPTPIPPLTSEQDVLNLLNQPGELSTQDYLRIQAFMQRESQTFTAVSNILKVRSDTTRAAINNIR
jgi:hypothetical protein